MPKAFSIDSISGRKDAFAPAPRTRDPIGVARLLEVYDDYQRLLHSHESAINRAELAEADSRWLEDKREEDQKIAKDKQERLESLLKTEKQDRQRDNNTAKEQADAAKAAAKKEKHEAELAMERRIRGQLQPRIDDLTEKLSKTTAERDTLKFDLDEKRTQLGTWTTQMEKLHKERQESEVMAKKAAENRESVSERLRELEEKMMEGLRLASQKPGEKVESKEEA